MLNFIFGFIIGAALAWWLVNKKRDSSALPQNDEVKTINPEQVEQKQKNLEKIMEMARDKGEISNDDVERELSVSNVHPPISMVYTYLLQSSLDQSFYTGIANDVDRRLIEHNGGRVVATKQKRPWRLVYAKPHASYAEARKHEKWLKKKNRLYKDKLAGQAAERYLNELEQQGRLEQIGKTGKSVIYRAK